MRQTQRTKRSPWRFLPPLLLLGTIFATLASSGCIFSARDPQAPLDVDVDWLPPFQPENVLANMAAGLEASYLTNYDDSLGEDFDFRPSTGAEQAASAGFYADFGKARELEGVQRLFTQVDGIDVAWNYGEEDLEEVGDEATFTLSNYELTVTYGDGSEQVFSGYAEITLAKSGSEWRVVLWDETQNTADLSWGHLRYNLSL